MIRYITAFVFTAIFTLAAMPMRATATPEPVEPLSDMLAIYKCHGTSDCTGPSDAHEGCAVDPSKHVTASNSRSARRKVADECQAARGKGWTCSIAGVTCDMWDHAVAAKWYCDGTVTCKLDGDSSQSRDCPYSRETFNTTKGASDAGRAARNKWIPDCRGRKSGTWNCKMSAGPSCDLGEK